MEQQQTRYKSGATPFYFRLKISGIASFKIEPHTNLYIISLAMSSSLYYNGVGIRVDKHERDTLERLATDDVRQRLKYSSATTIL